MHKSIDLFKKVWIRVDTSILDDLLPSKTSFKKLLWRRKILKQRMSDRGLWATSYFELYLDVSFKPVLCKDLIKIHQLAKKALYWLSFGTKSFKTTGLYSQQGFDMLTICLHNSFGCAEIIIEPWRNYEILKLHFYTFICNISVTSRWFWILYEYTKILLVRMLFFL